MSFDKLVENYLTIRKNGLFGQITKEDLVGYLKYLWVTSEEEEQISWRKKTLIAYLDEDQIKLITSVCTELIDEGKAVCGRNIFIKIGMMPNMDRVIRGLLRSATISTNAQMTENNRIKYLENVWMRFGEDEQVMWNDKAYIGSLNENEIKQIRSSCTELKKSGKKLSGYNLFTKIGMAEFKKHGL